MNDRPTRKSVQRRTAKAPSAKRPSISRPDAISPGAKSLAINPSSKQTGAGAILALRRIGNPEMARIAMGFFKTGRGQYGEGDIFLGIRVPDVRRVARDYRQLPLEEIGLLLQSELHEVRLAGLVVLVEQFKKADSKQRGALHRFYLDHLDRVNNWDLVDSSARDLVGAWLFEQGNTQLLDRLARSKSLWERRVAMVATWHFIREGVAEPTLRIAEQLLRDKHDLIHKASGWMLRELGKRDDGALRKFLDKHHAIMPRTMLRYAIERMSDADRDRYLGR